MKHESDQFGELLNISDALKRGGDPLPFIIEIHPTDVCNHRCDYCFHGGVGFDKNRVSELLSLSQYECLFEEMVESKLRHLTISGGGEPFADPRTPAILKCAQAAKLAIRVVSHGNYLREELLAALLLCRELRISIDAISASTYSAIRHVPGILLDKTLSNLRTIIARRNASQAPLNIGTTFLLTAKNISEVEAFCTAMLELGVDAVAIKQDIYSVHAVGESEFVKVQERLTQLGDPRIEIRDAEQVDVLAKPCFVPHFKATFNPYGELFSCPLGAQPGEVNGYQLGNLHKQTLKEIWAASFPVRRGMREHGVRCTDCNHTDARLSRDLLRLMHNG